MEVFTLSYLGVQTQPAEKVLLIFRAVYFIFRVVRITCRSAMLQMWWQLDAEAGLE
jgi:hypothetical protein